jgi:hypothetical protein
MTSNTDLSTPKDFFYVCPGHLKDRGFATPIVDQEAAAAKKKKEMEDEMARVKAEYEEKQRKKKEKEKEKDKDKDKDKEKDKDKDKETEKDEAKTDKKGDEKVRRQRQVPPFSQVTSPELTSPNQARRCTFNA